MPIIISKRGAGTIRVDASGVPEETMLQEYVQEHPEVLPLDEIREDVRLMIAAKEFPTNSGPIDVLAFDQTGEIYVIETKLYKNPDKRQVLAQALDYGASLWHDYTSGEKFTAELRAAFRGVSDEPFEEEIRTSFGLDDGEVQELLATLDTNLERGIFKFVILMDRMDDRLKDLITFVNENSRFTVYGVELEFYRHDDLEIVIPQLFGAEVRKDLSRSSPRRSWYEGAFFNDALEKLTSKQVAALRHLYEFSQQTADRVEFGTGNRWGSINVKYFAISEGKSIFTARSDGWLAFNFGWLGEAHDVAEFKTTLHDHLVHNLGLALPDDYREKYPQFAAGEWTDKVDEVIDALAQSLGVEGE